jgi:hypothetical protein
LPAAGGEVAQIQPPFWWQKNDQGITAEQAKQSTQAIDLAFGWGWQASNLRPSDYESLALTD